jgi:hypothetical protein
MSEVGLGPTGMAWNGAEVDFGRIWPDSKGRMIYLECFT